MTENKNKPSQQIITLEIPGNEQAGLQEERLEVEKRLIEGEVDVSIEFEATNEEITDKYAIEVKKRGARVFIDSDDCFLIVHSEESLKYLQYILDKQDYYQV